MEDILRWFYERIIELIGSREGLFVVSKVVVVDDDGNICGCG